MRLERAPSKAEQRILEDYYDFRIARHFIHIRSKEWALLSKRTKAALMEILKALSDKQLPDSLNSPSEYAYEALLAGKRIEELEKAMEEARKALEKIETGWTYMEADELSDKARSALSSINKVLKAKEGE